MKSMIKFFAILCVILLLSVFLAPILYDYLPFKFERIFNRLIMIFSLAAIVIFVRFRKDWISYYGLTWTPQSSRFFITSFWVSCVVLASYAVFYISFRYAAWKPADFSPAVWLGKVATALVTGVLVGFIEEFFFRGFIFQTVKDRFLGFKDRESSAHSWRVWLALTLTSLFYSSLHFVNVKKPLIGADPGIRDSLRLIYAPIKSFAQWESLWPAFVGLFVFGFILNCLVVRSGSLYASMGLHAGCVFFIKMDGSFVDFHNQNRFLFGSSKLYDGVIGWGVLLLLFLILNFYLFKKSRPLKA